MAFSNRKREGSYVISIKETIQINKMTIGEDKTLKKDNKIKKIFKGTLMWLNGTAKKMFQDYISNRLKFDQVTKH